MEQLERRRQRIRGGFAARVRAAAAAIVVLASLALPACQWHEHRVGGGPNGLGEESQRQYYILFGLLRLNEADVQRMTDGLNSYGITTEISALDLLLAPLLLPLTVTSRTVTVHR